MTGFIDISVNHAGSTVAGAPVLTSVQARVEQLRPALEQIAEDFRDRQAVAFATAGFGTWAPDDPATIAAKAGGRTLVDTGGLLASLTRPGARYAVARATNDEVLLGTRSPVARLHRRGARGMPERNPVPPTTAAERARWAGGLAVYIVDGEAR